MIKKFIGWFIVFGLSFLIQSFGWTTQGKAFMSLHLIGWAFFILLMILIALFGGTEGIAFSIVGILYIVGSLGVVLFATWGATQLWEVELTVAYQIMTFGQCLVDNSDSKKDKQ